MNTDSVVSESSKADPVFITEDEAALYDRQIRLWGLEAQQRMRNATILVINLKGVATEVVKNIVLAGIGKLILIDGADVAEEDLGAGFFFRDEDVGSKRVHVAKARVENLNPLVAVETLAADPRDAALDRLVQGVDLVCVTDSDKETLIWVNGICRRHDKKFYAGGTFGLLGYIFCDLLEHEFIAPDRSTPTEPGMVPKTIKHSAVYAPLEAALKHSWKGLSKKKTKELNPAVVFTCQAIMEYQSRHSGQLPDELDSSDELESIANDLMKAAEVNPETLTAVPRAAIEAASRTAAHEFSPVCAVVGGFLAQDALKALAAREAPLANFFTFDGVTGSGAVCPMAMATV
ncbi:hypothetical protein BOTBODRAFT_50847 [Botryobasidium botryosum FD-172 SS1]|uniref:Ubiquitin-like 1-activating enzyme E1A n=1 Tax=Botryobasidium botryosum (strain FD-172 SS1) TaxID=930990 RepID=A0A067N9K6_BOTB1|nr:hypothetical protein BOTBODRAFT_50847 [Botryobasidium botryosum FD-172 SS1]